MAALRFILAFLLALSSGAANALTARGALPWTAYYHSNVTIQIGLGASISYSVNVPRNGAGVSVHAGIACQIADGASRIARFLLFAGDQYSGDPAGSRRNELSGSPSPFAPGVKIYGAYSIKIDAPPNASDPAVMGQMHASNDVGASPFLAFRVGGSSAGATTLNITTQGSTENPLITNPSATVRYTGTLALHVFHTIYFEELPGPGGTGTLKVAIDGVVVLDLTGIVIDYTQDSGPYWAFGAYKSPDGSTNFVSVTYANMEIGTTDLSARIAAPLAIQ